MKVLITRPRAQSNEFAEKLCSVGFEPIFFPVIEIQPVENNVALDRALEKLNCYEWVIFTSVNAVDAVAQTSHPLGGGALARLKRMEKVKFAAIGPKTAEALRTHGITPEFVPQEYVAEAILPGLGDLLGKWVLLPRAEIARKELPEAIFDAGGVPHEITVYKTIPAQPDLEGLIALRSGVDVITLTSQSTVQNFIAIAKRHGLDPLRLPNDPLFACIGPITEQTAREAGLPNVIVAKEYTTDGLITALKHLEA